MVSDKKSLDFLCMRVKHSSETRDPRPETRDPRPETRDRVNKPLFEKRTVEVDDHFCIIARLNI